MRLSATGLDFIKQHESFRAKPYYDPGGYLTIGYGHRIKPGESFTSITHDEALQLLANDVQWAEAAVNRLVTVPLTQSSFDALASLVFNWGAGQDAFGGSSLLRKLNAGDYQGAAQRLSEWPITSGGKVLPGLVRRRQEEAAMFLSGGVPGGAATQPSPADPARPDGGATTQPDPDAPDNGSSLMPWLAIGAALVVAWVFLAED